jgi:anti-sigma-K factor RskA
VTEGRALPDDDDLLAAELVLGLLEGADRVAAEARLVSDQRFAAAVEQWQQRCATIVDAGELDPPAWMWRAISAKLAANDDAPIAVGPKRSTLRWWQASTALASALALAFGFVALDRRPAPVQAAVISAPLVAVLSGSDRGILVTVSFDRTSGRLLLTPAGLHIGKHSAELWVIPDGRKPRSLGVIAEHDPSYRPAPSIAAEALAPGAALAISLEQPGGSPSGQPTGTIILKGKLKTI